MTVTAWCFSFSLLSAIINITYFMRNDNGKAVLRLFSGVIMLYFSYVFAAEFFGAIPSAVVYDKFIKGWLVTLFFVPVFDAYVDWKQKESA